jgi:recombinational DNA repair protein RecR
MPVDTRDEFIAIPKDEARELSELLERLAYFAEGVTACDYCKYLSDDEACPPQTGVGLCKTDAASAREFIQRLRGEG